MVIKKIFKKVLRAFAYALKPYILEIINSEIRVWGSRKKLFLSDKAQMVNTLFNTSSGIIKVGAYTFAGHNVSIITGTHKYTVFSEQRLFDVPKAGNDIIIGEGVWIGSNATILGPAIIGDHAVIAAGAVVVGGSNIPAYSIAGGVPAKILKIIDSAARE